MAGRGAAAEPAEAARMQAGIRAWVLSTAHGGGRRLRELPPAALLSLVCAGALAPLVAVGAGVTGAVAVAGAGVLSSVGSGVLGEVIMGAIDRLRPRRGQDAPSQTEVTAEIAGQLEQVLARQDATAREVRAEIAALLTGIDAGGTVLRAAIDSGDEQLRGDVIAALGTLSAGFTELRFLLTDVRQSAADIQQQLDEQAADVRVVIQQNARQSTEIRLARAELAAIGRHTWGPAAEAPDRPAARWADGCPYRGLLPFGEEDTEVFYGRERVTAELAVLVSEQAARGGVLVVTGASGAGKSSLLRAGLMPALAQGVQVTGSAGWLRTVLTPTADPLTELAAQLAALGGGDARAVRDGLAQQPGQAHLAVHQALLASRWRDGQAAGGPPAAGARLVLVVDQFEQTFTLAPQVEGEASRQAFITALHAAASSPAGPEGLPPALVIIAVRGDFCDRCAGYPELADSLQHGQFVVGPMSEAELRLAITGPAETAGLRVEAGLTDLIIADLRARYPGDVVGALPLLSQAMLRTWANRDGDRLTVHGYGQAGGVSGAVQASADGVYQALAPGRQPLAREIFRNMTVVGQDGRLSRRPVSRPDLYAAPGGAAQAEVDGILEAFAAERLIVLDGGTAQIAHDVLLTAWPTLRGWLEDDQASSILRSQLAEDATAWAGQARDPSYLYRGAQLLTLRQATATWAASPDRYPALTGTQRDFLAASGRAAARSTRWRRVLAAVLAVLFLGSVAGAGVALAAAHSAEQQRNLAVSSQLAAESLALDSADPLTAGQLAAAAWQIAHTPQAYESLLQVFAQPERAVLQTRSAGRTEPAFSPDGRILVTAGTYLRWWNPATQHQIGPAVSPPEGAYGVAFSPDGRLLATADGNGTAQLWSVPTHRPAGPALRVPGGTISVAFSPDGRVLATAGMDGAARLWDVRTHRQIGAPLRAGDGGDPANGGVNGVAFSPNGKILATAGADGTARLWNVQSHRQIGAAMAVPGGAYSVAFNPAGTMLATAGGDGTAGLWDVHTQRPIGAPMTVGPGLDQTIEAVAFSPDDRLLATVGIDGSARLWNVATHGQVGAAMPASAGAGAVGVAFSPSGRVLATGGFDSTARLWDIAAFQQIGSPLRAGHDLQAVAFRPDGRTLATAGFDGTTQLWDTVDHRPTSPPLAGSPNGNFAVLSPDGSTVVTDASANEVTLWNIPDGRRIGNPLTPKPTAQLLTLSPDGQVLAIAELGGQVQLWSVAGHRPLGAPLGANTGSDVDALAFSSAGRLLAIATGNGQVQLWDVGTHRPVGPVMAADDDLTAMAFSPHRRLLATAGADGTVRLWDLATFRQAGLPLAATQSVPSVAFSPDGRLLATANSDGTARLWDTATDHQIGPALTATAHGGVTSVAFSPGGGVLATAADDGTARLWDVAIPRHLLGAVCSIAGRALTRAQWAAYAPTEPYRPVCAQRGGP